MVNIHTVYEEGINVEKCGADIVGTTMSGYTAYTEAKDEPDYELMNRLPADLDIPVIGEGKIHSPEEAVKTLDTGVQDPALTKDPACVIVRKSK